MSLLLSNPWRCSSVSRIILPALMSTHNSGTVGMGWVVDVVLNNLHQALLMIKISFFWPLKSSNLLFRGWKSTFLYPRNSQIYFFSSKIYFYFFWVKGVWQGWGKITHFSRDPSGKSWRTLNLYFSRLKSGKDYLWCS